MLRMFFIFNAVLSLIRGIRAIIGLAILVVIVGFIYILVTNDYDVMLAFNQITTHIMAVFYWLRDWVEKLIGLFDFELFN